jgi:hypothetical protein
MANVNKVEAQRKLIEQCIWLRLAMQEAAPVADGYLIHRHLVEAQEKFDQAFAAIDTLEACGRETLEELEATGEVV